MAKEAERAGGQEGGKKSGETRRGETKGGESCPTLQRDETKRTRERVEDFRRVAGGDREGGQAMKPQPLLRLASCINHLRQMREELEALQLDIRFKVQRERAMGRIADADSALVILLNDMAWEQEAKP